MPYHGPHPGSVVVEGINYPGMPRNPQKPSTHKPGFILGLDLGQLTDFAALSLVRRSVDTYADDSPVRDELGRLVRRHDVLALKRYELGTDYVDVVKDVKSKVDQFPGIKLVMDATGVGRPIVDMFNRLLVEVHAITITGGKNWSNPSPYEYHVSKFELVAAVRVALETKQLKVAKFEDPTIGILFRKELMSFKVHKSKSQTELYDAREGEHDDLVLAVAIIVWYSYMMDQFRLFIAGPASKVDIPKANSIMGGIMTSLSGLLGRRGLPSSGIMGEQDHGQRPPQPPHPGPSSGIFGDPGDR